MSKNLSHPGLGRHVKAKETRPGTPADAPKTPGRKQLISNYCMTSNANSNHCPRFCPSKLQTRHSQLSIRGLSKEFSNPHHLSPTPSAVPTRLFFVIPYLSNTIRTQRDVKELCSTLDHLYPVHNTSLPFSTSYLDHVPLQHDFLKRES